MSTRPSDIHASSALTVVIPTHNGRERLCRCLDSLRAQSQPPSAIIVVDDASSDGTAAVIAEVFPEVRVVTRASNGGFCKAINEGLRMANTEAVMTLNDDMTLAPDALERLMAAWSDEVVVGPLILFDDDPGIVYAAGDRLLSNGRPESIGFRQSLEHFSSEEPIAGITAGAAIYPRALLEQIGGFDERFVAYFDDMDVSLRLRWLGIEPVLVREAIARHEGAASIQGRTWWRTRQCSRNHAMLVLKHWPWRLLIRNAPGILREGLAGIRRTFNAARVDRGSARALVCVLGVMGEWCWLLPCALIARHRIARKVSAGTFESWLTPQDRKP